MSRAGREGLRAAVQHLVHQDTQLYQGGSRGQDGPLRGEEVKLRTSPGIIKSHQTLLLLSVVIIFVNICDLIVLSGQVMLCLLAGYVVIIEILIIILIFKYNNKYTLYLPLPLALTFFTILVKFREIFFCLLAVDEFKFIFCFNINSEVKTKI